MAAVETYPAGNEGRHVHPNGIDIHYVEPGGGLVGPQI